MKVIDKGKVWAVNNQMNINNGTKKRKYRWLRHMHNAYRVQWNTAEWTRWNPKDASRSRTLSMTLRRTI